MVPTNPRNSISVCQSRPLRANRDASFASTVHAPFADCRQQAVEAGMRDAATRATEIIGDDLDLAPSELLGAIDEPILSVPTLLIARQLIAVGCRI